jgi:hypothetical protein
VRKNGSNIPLSASRESVASTEQVLGTVSLVEFMNAGDGLEVCFATTSGQMDITFFAPAGDVPVVPSIITNIIKL